eukprot:1587812-Prymnesium_polylepis.1
MRKIVLAARSEGCRRPLAAQELHDATLCGVVASWRRQSKREACVGSTTEMFWNRGQRAVGSAAVGVQLQ